MAGCSAESLKIKKVFTHWLSLTSLKSLNPDDKSSFRKLERLETKLIKLKSHLQFNETCLINKLLPTYTNVKLHDDAARTQQFVLDFRLSLIERQINEQASELKIVDEQRLAAISELRLRISSPIKFAALECLLTKTKERIAFEMKNKQHSKLCRLYGGNILMKQTRDSVINLSDKFVSEEIQEILSMGMNYHLQSKFDSVNRQTQVEKLYEDIKLKESTKLLEIDDDASLEAELERFGLKQQQPCKNPLTKEQGNLIKEFSSEESVIMRKADKSNVYVLLNKEHYVRSIEDILKDNSKFSKLDNDPTEKLKKELNALISKINSAAKEPLLQKLQGHFEPGYIYANPKIHKSVENPPFRPIISQIGTVTYCLSKYLNSLIIKYLPKKYQVDSTYEFLTILNDNHSNGMLASIDAENLFSNVPVNGTIDIILQHVYESTTEDPPKIPKHSMEALLRICTTRTPFRNLNGDIYVQREGVSMGNPLGPTFANFYMCDLENNVFLDYPDLKPILYVRYVDDVCIIVDKFDKLVKLKQMFEARSVLTFTYETEVEKKMPFLDVMIGRKTNKFTTSVHVKSTSGDDCINYDSVCPERYKYGVIKSMLHRAYAICGDWNEFDKEVQRLKQLFSNNNYPLYVVENIINSFINSKVMKVEANSQEKTDVTLYFESQMTQNYKQDENQLKAIINSNIRPVAVNDRVKLIIYYKSRKLKNLFIKNNMHNSNQGVSSRHHCVYQYSCDQAGCNSSQTYIGHTTCSILARFRMHTQNSSSIKKHLQSSHQIQRISTNELLPNVKVLKYSSNKRDLLITEALLIKSLKPSLNSQTEFSDKLLKIFIH